MTTNVWINRIMKDIPQFIGVCSLDNLPMPTSFPSYIIINFSPSNLPGTHLITVLFLKNNVLLYFDPLNLPYIPCEILSYMLKNTTNIFKLDYTVQNFLSSFCGFFCLLPIMLHVNKLPVLQGILSFNERDIHNDEKCIYLLTIYFNCTT